MQPRRAGHLVQPRARRPAPHKQGSTPARTCCRRWFADVDQESLSRPSTSTSPPPPQFRLCSTESKTTTYEKENIDYQTYFYARPRGEPKEEIPRSEFCRYTGRNLFQWQRWPLLGLHVIAFILCPTKKIRSSAIMALSLWSAEDTSPAATPYELRFLNQW
ncbi:uncharacterized protein [Lolium perenne]|uniref:uncharacterized protein isoform X2 n=1 Tax=Lolium perenne TaxID=4522 RepID=UPI003A9A111A